MSPIYIARSCATAARVLGGTTILMSPQSSFFQLNEVASAIWQAADGRTPLPEIVAQAVCSVFEVDPQVAQADAEELVRQLAQHGLLIVSDRPIEPGDRE
jgi:hypothetical protein